MKITGSKGIFLRLMAGLLCGCLLGAPKALAQPELSLASEAAVLMDADTGQVLYAKNPDERLYPASITKIMTAMLALRELQPDQVLTVSAAAVNAVPVTSSHISLLPGEQLTVEQAMYAIGMESANDAANVLAEAASGDLSSFGVRMTEQAHILGAVNTNFTNANGLPDSQHYTTAYDMARITAAALKEPGLTQYFSRVDYVLPATNLSDARVFANKDRLLPGGQYYYDGVLMAKTGWTTSAQGTFAAVVRRGDRTLIAITLKSPMLEDKYQDTHKLMDYGFSSFVRVSVTGEELEKRLQLGEFQCIWGQTLLYLMPSDAADGDVRYRLLSPLPEVEEDAVQIAVDVGEDTVAVLSLALRRSRPKKEVIVKAVDELLEETIETVEKVNPIWLVAPAGIVLLMYVARQARRQHLRHVRREHLRKRIDRMKKQMRG